MGGCCCPRYSNWLCTRKARLDLAPEIGARTHRDNKGGYWCFPLVSLQFSFAVLLESRAVPWWARETSGSRGAPSSHRWILSLQPCSHHSTGSSSPHLESICRGCHSGGPRNFQLQPFPQYGYLWPPLVSVQCQHILKETFKWFSKNASSNVCEP